MIYLLADELHYQMAYFNKNLLIFTRALDLYKVYRLVNV